MSLANNPLKQYFRRPSIYLKLPSGGIGYPAGALNKTDTGELPIYPMTAIDEITSKTPDALFNGSAIVEIIKSCVPDIRDPWSIPSTDLDAILIAIRSAAQGNDMEIESECPSCKEVATYAINLIGILQTMKPGDYTKELQTGDLFIKFRPLTYREMNQASMAQFEIQKMFSTMDALPEEERTKKTQEAIVKITEVTMAVLAQTIEYVRTPKMNIDFINTTSVEGFDGGKLFGQAVVIRKISKFIAGTDEDQLIPIPVFYDLESKKILPDSLPPELREEYKSITLSA